MGYFDPLDSNENEGGDMPGESVFDLRSAERNEAACRDMHGRKLLQNTTWGSIGSGGAYQVEPNDVVSFTHAVELIYSFPVILALEFFLTDIRFGGCIH